MRVQSIALLSLVTLLALSGCSSEVGGDHTNSHNSEPSSCDTTLAASVAASADIQEKSDIERYEITFDRSEAAATIELLDSQGGKYRHRRTA